MKKRFLALAVCLGASLAALPAAAQDLTLIWKRASGEVAKREVLTGAQVEAMKLTEVVTATPWTNGKNTFRGPALEELAGRGGAPVRDARVLALNDYSQTIPAEDWAKHAVILASRMDGKTMPIRDKGPYWVIYPLDSDGELRSQRIHARMVWQVKTVEFTLR
jgi:hypothetical protein